MKTKYFLAIILLSVTFKITAQDAPNKTDGNGKKQGHWIKLDENKKKIYDGNFVDDIPEGKFIYYYDTGTEKAITTFSEKGKIARTKMYDVGGKLTAQGKYIDQKRDSIWKFYSPEGVVISDESYINGIKNGKYHVYYPSGGIAEEKIWKEGKLNGEVKKYFEEGQLKYHANLIDDKVEGITTYYFPSGKVQAEGLYLHDVKHGEWKYYNEDGKIKRIDKYSHGRNLEPDKDVISKEEMEKAKKKAEEAEFKDPYK